MTQLTQAQSKHLNQIFNQNAKTALAQIQALHLAQVQSR